MQKPVDFPVSLIKDNSFAGSKHIQEMLMKNMSAVTRNHIRNQRIFSLVRQFLHGSDQFPSIVLHNVIQHSQCLPQGDSLSDEMIEDTIHAAWKLEMLGHLTARQVVERVMAPLVVDLKDADSLKKSATTIVNALCLMNEDGAVVGTSLFDRSTFMALDFLFTRMSKSRTAPAGDSLAICAQKLADRLCNALLAKEQNDRSIIGIIAHHTKRHKIFSALARPQNQHAPYYYRN